MRFYRVIDNTLHCFDPDLAEPQGYIFRDQGEWETFWDENVTCWYDSGEPRVAPEFDWGSYVLLTVISDAGAYNGCVYELLPLVPAISQREGVLLVLTRKPTPEELGPCDSYIQPRDVLLLERYLDEAFPIEFSFETWE